MMTNMASSSGIPVPALAQFGALARVAFVNPNAAQARSVRRQKLAASRARQAASLKIVGVALASTSSADGAVDDEKENRRQQRMLRNRESAAMSRKRKSDRVGELEEQVDLLQEENRYLRERIHQLEAGTTVAGGVNLGTKPIVGDDGTQERVDCIPLSPSHAVIDQPEVLANRDSLSSSSSDSAEAYDSIDHLFVELMAEDVAIDSGHDGGTGGETEVGRGSQNDVLLFLEGVDGVKAPAVINKGSVPAV